MNPALIPVLLDLVTSGKLDSILGDKANLFKEIVGNDKSQANVLGAITVLVEHAPNDENFHDEYLSAVHNCLAGLLALKSFPK